MNLKRPKVEQVEIEVATKEAGAKNITIYFLNEIFMTYNRPFPRSLVPLFQNKSKCETFDNYMKTSSTCSFIFMQINVIFIRMASHLD